MPQPVTAPPQQPVVTPPQQSVVAPPQQPVVAPPQQQSQPSEQQYNLQRSAEQILQQQEQKLSTDVANIEIKDQNEGGEGTGTPPQLIRKKPFWFKKGNNCIYLKM